MDDWCVMIGNFFKHHFPIKISDVANIFKFISTSYQGKHI
jgi:hypothetical protein